MGRSKDREHLQQGRYDRVACPAVRRAVGGLGYGSGALVRLLARIYLRVVALAGKKHRHKNAGDQQAKGQASDEILPVENPA